VLAVIERPGGFDRALQGVFPPGSTFKVVTASALSGTGLRPASSVQCPAQVNVGGRVFHNFDNEHLGATSLQTAFAVSCNSTFITLATQRLNGAALASTAALFGFNSQPSLGIPATLGRFTTPHTPVDLAADAFGQGTDLVNPLSEASMAGAVEDGTWRPPQLVLSPVPKQSARPQQLGSTVLSTLRPMMRAVVTTGTAAKVGFQAGVFGKTGTAEFGTSSTPRAHAWFVGYRGDVAFAVLVEGGGVGADASAPIANAVLGNLCSRGGSAAAGDRPRGRADVERALAQLLPAACAQQASPPRGQRRHVIAGRADTEREGLPPLAERGVGDPDRQRGGLRPGQPGLPEEPGELALADTSQPRFVGR
jgi:cell division protein FtsI/penicillin-binding protein 2